MTKLSFTTMATPNKNAREAIEMAKKYGYQGIDLRISPVKGELLIDSSDNEIKEIRSILDDNGIELAGLLSYNEVGSPEIGSWDDMRISLLKHMEIGLKLKSPAIRMFGGNLHGDIPTGDYIKRSAETILKALDECNENIDIVLQNHKGSYNAMEGIELCKAVNSERFGLTFSPDHCLMLGENIDEVLKVIKPYAKQMYASDIVMNEDGSRKAILPGKGEVPLKTAYEAIGGDDFTGFVSFKWEKIWQDHLPEPEVALPHFINFWKNL